MIPWDKLHEECGVFGIRTGGATAATYVHLGLYALQHRGQESAGIATHDGARTHVVKDMGLVAQVFSRDRLATLPGCVGIGHVRYSTMGGARLANAQPFLEATPWGTLALAHNGNLVNAPLLRAELEERGSRFSATSDTEVITKLIATAPVATLEEAVAHCMGRIRGAYTVVAMVGETLIAFRDPNGIRPLEMGRLGHDVVFASETCAFDHIGAEAVREVGPGELLIADTRGLRSIQVLPVTRRASCVFEYIYFARPDTVLEARSVHHVRRRMGRVLACEHPASADIVIAVPDSGTSAAMGYAEVAGIPHEVGLIKNRYIGRTFIQPDPSMRDFGVRVKLNPVADVIAGRRIVLVDDSIVRGTTSRQIVRLLRRAGAREVHVRISSPPIRNACFYGIDTSNRGELVAARLKVDEIRAEIEADTLGYLSMGGLVEALRLSPGNLCLACLGGAYPTETPTEATAGRFALEAPRV
ncbi:MAG TPA: amidophosphoribosyltransferase [bacterium]|nr:amidophosphoribosyltransferase [bacterium]